MDISRGRERPFPSGRPLSSSASGFSAWALGHWGGRASFVGGGAALHSAARQLLPSRCQVHSPAVTTKKRPQTLPDVPWGAPRTDLGPGARERGVSTNAQDAVGVGLQEPPARGLHAPLMTLIFIL